MLDMIETALNARIGQLTGFDLVYEGRSHSPKAGKPYLTAKLIHTSAPTGAGPNPGTMWSGTLNLVVFSPAAEGKPAATRRAVAVSRHFPRALTLLEQEAYVVVETCNITAAYTSGDWISVPVAVAWFSEELPQQDAMPEGYGTLQYFTSL